MNKLILSIIIVNYNVEKELFECLTSISKKIKGIKFEVIVVENNPKENLARKLLKFEFVKYVRSKKNLGYGGGNNLGALNAQGEYLFFLNPDTKILSGTIKGILSEFENKKIGITAPLLLDQKLRIYPLQGTKKLTPIAALFSLSIVNKIWPSNPVARKYWLIGVNRHKTHKVDVVPGTALIIKRELFEKLGGFDENFFLYFEEHDLCNRVKDLGYKIYMCPKLKVMHLWAASTKKEKGINKIYNESRSYYFKKNYGRVISWITCSLMDINLNSILFLMILFIGAFLRLDRLFLSMFISDQAWFYLSARDLLSGQIPLVGITSSHTWLHQGPFWTYMLAPVLYLFNYNPISGVYLAAFFGFLSMILIYKIGSEFFSQKFGLFAVALYAVSPLIVIHERMAYHTAPISFFTMLFIFFTIKWIRGSAISFALAIGTLSVLYNFELAAVILWSVIFFFFAVGLLQKQQWFKKILNTKIICISLLAFILPMTPVIVYDLSHGFFQTFKFAVWLIYSPIESFWAGRVKDTTEFIFFTKLHLERLVFLSSFSVSAIILLSSILLAAKHVGKKIASPLGVIFLTTVFSLIIFVFEQTPSEAYLPMLFPQIILIIAYFFYFVYLKNKMVGVILLLTVIFINVFLVYTQNFLMEKPFGYGWAISKEIKASKDILSLADGEKYNLVLDKSVKFINYQTYNYEYLTWWLGGNPPAKEEVNKKIVVFKDENTLKVFEAKK